MNLIMGYKSKNTPLFQNNWNFGSNTFGSIFNRRKHTTYSKIKELYGFELSQANNKFRKIKPLDKEERRRIKEKVRRYYKNKILKNILSFFIALAVLLLIIYVVSYFLNEGIIIYSK